MIKYRLVCYNSHSFDAWFKDSDSYGGQLSDGLLECPICGSTEVQKAIMSPSIMRSAALGRNVSIANDDEEDKTDLELLKEYITQAKQYIEENYQYVGSDFAKRTIDMKNKKIAKENIYGEAEQKDLESMDEEGIDYFILPFSNKKKH